MALPRRVQELAQQASDLSAQAKASNDKDAGNTDQSKAAPTTATQVPDARDEKISSLQLQLDAANARAEVLRTKYDAEVPRYAQQVRDLKGNIRLLEEEIQTLKSQRAPDKPLTGAELGLTQEEVDTFGEPFLTAVGKAASKIAQQKIDEFKATLKPVDRVTDVDPPAKVAKQPAREEGMDEVSRKFYLRLAELVPAWREQNDDPGFLKWLDEADPTTKHTRISMLTDAHKAWDVYTVAEIFRAFKESREIGSARPVANIDPGPGLNAGAPPPGGNVKRIWTSADINQFYKDKATQKYRGREKEARDMELDIIAAQKEGRIRR